MLKYMAAVLGVAIAATQAWGVVLHVDATPSDKPADAVVGRWGSATTCVAVGPEWVVAATHQGGGAGTPVTLGGATYVVTEVHDSGYDFRLARVARPDGSRAALADYVALSHDPVSLVGRKVVVAGYGRSRGAPLVGSDGTVYGYLWGTAGVLRWGTNTVDAVYGNFLSADFDPPPVKPLSTTTTTTTDSIGSTTRIVGTPRTLKTLEAESDGEAVLASGDSGGGWFARHPETGRWEMVGLSVSVSRDGASWFNPPDCMYAVRSSLCAAWAEAIMAAATPLTVTAATDVGWIYENAPLTTLNRHDAVLVLSVTDDPCGNDAYDVTVEQTGGSGLVVVEPTEDPMVWVVRSGPVASAAAGDVVLTIGVRGLDAGGQGQTACPLTVRRLGDVDNNGGVEPTDLSALINCLNGCRPEGCDPRAFDLDGNGGAEPTDAVILINVLNGIMPT